MSKQIVFDFEAHNKAAEGIAKLAKAVASTLGPSGQFVMIQNQMGPPIITNDGVTVAKHIELEDPFENMGAKMAIEVASKTNDEAGDGTTTATVIANAIIKHGLKRIAAGNVNQGIRRGMDKAVGVAIERLRKMSRPVKTKKELEAVATISASQDEEIGKLMSDAIDKVGPEGVVAVREGNGLVTALEYVEGLSLDSGFLSPHFVTDPGNMNCEYEDVLILVANCRLTTTQDMVPILEKVAAIKKPLLIIADNISNDVLTLLVINRLRGTISPVAIHTPAVGAARRGMLDDIAISVGATVVDNDSEVNMKTVALEHLGKAKRIQVTRNRTTIFDGKADKKALAKHIELVKTQASASLDDREVDMLRKRVAILTSSIAQVDVGGYTESEIKERMFRVEDALHATRAAKQEGIVAGGGVAYIRASQAIREHEGYTPDEKIGAMILADALEEPAKLIASNAGYEGVEVVSTIKKSDQNYGFNAATGEYGDLVEMGIIDPTKVARCAIQNAASIASLILATNTLVTEKVEEAGTVLK